MTKDIRFRPFISANLLRLIAMILLGIAQVASVLMVYMKISGNLTSDLARELTWYKNLVNLSTPFILVTIIANVTRNPQSLKKYCIKYFIYAILFYAFEIILFRCFIVPFLEQTFMYMLNVEGQMPKEAHIIILKMLSYISSSFSNLNTFIDVFICTLFAFFVLYQPKFKHQKSIKIFRTMTILPVIYIVASFILIGFNKMGYISYGIEFGALLIHRSYVCLLFFIFIILYIKYKRKTMSNEDDDKYLGYVNTNRGLMYFNIVIVSVLLVLSTFDFLLSFIPNSEYFNVGSSYYIIVGIPLLLLLFNSQRKKHNKITNVLIASYMTIIGLIITGIFIMISAEAFNYIELIAQIFKAFKEI